MTTAGSSRWAHSDATRVSRDANSTICKALVAGSAVSVVAGVQLFILAEHTERFFAWTIGVPLSAAFMGAFYWAGAVAGLLSVRRPLWVRVRSGVYALTVFTWLVLLATVVHLDQFHLSVGGPLARVAAWAWLAIYVLYPLVLTVGIMQQRGYSGGDPPREVPLPVWTRLTLFGAGGLLLAVGAVLVLAPAVAEPLWPWQLTPLTSRMIGAWVVAQGVWAVAAGRENDWTRLGPVMVELSLVAILQLIALARYAAAVDWTRPQAWAYLVFWVGVVTFGVYGWRAVRRSEATSR